MSKNSKGTNFKYGFQIDIDGSGGLGDEKFIPGGRDYAVNFAVAAATIPVIFYTAPAACKIVKVIERHVTVAGQAGTMQIEKVPSGTAIGSGTVLLATAFDLTSTANTNVTVNALTTAAGTLAAGDSLACKVASGAATSYAGGTVTVVLEYL